MVAGAGLAVTTALSTASALLLRPDGMTSSDTVSLTVALVGATFGAGYSGSHERVMDSSSATFELAAHGTPLLFTLVALSVMTALFKRRTARCSSVTPAIGDALLAALLTAVPVFVISLVVRDDAESITSLFTGEGRGEGSYGVSRPGALLGTLVLVFTVLVLSCVTRRDWLGESSRLHDLLAAPLRGLVALLWSLPVLGILGFALVLIPAGDADSVRWEHVRDDKALAAGIAITASGNAGLELLGLGLGAPVGVTAEFGGVAQAMADSANDGHGIGPLERTRVLTWAKREPGLGVAPILALAALATAAFRVLSRSTRTRRKADLTRWVIALGCSAPLLAWFGSVRYLGESRFQSEGGLPPLSAGASWTFGLDPLQFTIALVLGAAAMAVLALVVETDR